MQIGNIERFEIGNIEYLIGTMFFIFATVYYLLRFIGDIRSGRIDGFVDVAVPIVIIVISVCIAVFCCGSYIISLPDRCNNCGKAVDTKYCTHCGLSVERPESVYVCEDCGEEIDTEYCGDCGGKRALHIPIEVNCVE